MVALHIEIRPKYLIPDTNCFIDDLELIMAIAKAHPLYQLMIPLVGEYTAISIYFIMLK
jgi:protein SMG6